MHKTAEYIEKLTEPMRDNRDLMMEMCLTNDLKIVNTMYRKRLENIATYRKRKETEGITGEAIHQDTHEQIDYILVTQRWRNSVTNAESDTQANINTDHYPVKATIQVRLRKEINTAEKPQPREIQ